MGELAEHFRVGRGGVQRAGQAGGGLAVTAALDPATLAGSGERASLRGRTVAVGRALARGQGGGGFTAIVPHMPMPLEIIGLGRTTVTIVWSESERDVWSAHDLRIICACALCQSETTGEQLLDPASVPADLAVTHMDLVGNYGLAIHFSDGHTTGIYRLQRLYQARRQPEPEPES